MSNQTDTSALERAITYLGATEVAPGRYAYRDDATHRYYVVTADVMERLPQYLDAEDDSHTASHGGYSEWCADTQAVEMPAWWTPERREAWRMTCDGGHVGARDASERFAAWPAEHLTCSERITADLETGAEVPA